MFLVSVFGFFTEEVEVVGLAFMIASAPFYIGVPLALLGLLLNTIAEEREYQGKVKAWERLAEERSRRPQRTDLI